MHVVIAQHAFSHLHENVFMAYNSSCAYLFFLEKLNAIQPGPEMVHMTSLYNFIDGANCGYCQQDCDNTIYQPVRGCLTAMNLNHGQYNNIFIEIQRHNIVLSY